MQDRGGKRVLQVSQYLSLFSSSSLDLAPWIQQAPLFRRLEMENERREDDGEDDVSLFPVIIL